MALKKITYDNVDYLYEFTDNFFDYGTYVYESEPTLYYAKKYIFFGPLVLKKNYKFLFSLHMNIEDASYTSTDIENKFEYQIKKINRQKEIENGNIL